MWPIYSGRVRKPCRAGISVKRFRVPERTLLDLEYLVDLLSDIYQPEEARLWFYSRQRLLGGVAPAEMIRAGKIQELITAVDQLRDGVHV
jgi:hypothetical protein